MGWVIISGGTCSLPEDRWVHFNVTWSGIDAGTVEVWPEPKKAPFTSNTLGDFPKRDEVKPDAG